MPSQDEEYLERRLEDAVREYKGKCSACGTILKPTHWKLILIRKDGYNIYAKKVQNYCDGCLNARVERNECLRLNPRYKEF